MSYREPALSPWFVIPALGIAAWLLLDLEVGPIPKPSQLFGQQQVTIGSPNGTSSVGTETAPQVSQPTSSQPAVTQSPSPVLPSPVATPSKPNGVVISLDQMVFEVTFNGTSTNYGFESGELTQGSFKITGLFAKLPNGYTVAASGERYQKVQAVVTLTSANVSDCGTNSGLGLAVPEDSILLLELGSEQDVGKNALQLPAGRLAKLIEQGQLACGTSVTIRR